MSSHPSSTHQTTELTASRKALPTPGKRASAVLAVAVHLILLGFLIYGIHWQTRSPEAIEVELVSSTPAPNSTPLEREPTAKALPLPSLPPKLPPAPLPTPVKPDIAIKHPEKTPPPAKPEPPASKLALDPFKAALEQELRQTAERKANAHASAAAAAAEQELAHIKEAQASAARNKAMTGYIDKIRGKIRGNIVLPPDIKGNPEAIFVVLQLPSGEIINVIAKKSSGHSGYDAAVERAIRKSSPLPKPDQANLFERELKLTFHPLDD